MKVVVAVFSVLSMGALLAAAVPVSTPDSPSHVSVTKREGEEGFVLVGDSLSNLKLKATVVTTQSLENRNLDKAFSHNPTDDSFGPLPAQAGPNTNYPNERFLSY
ncbi:hypothetical protein BKA57DRAFT_508412 [Linnemannia elongata]|nr:hypothetical protein BKA57DRAFT_508412 [Linnemannia elongata]